MVASDFEDVVVLQDRALEEFQRGMTVEGEFTSGYLEEAADMIDRAL